MDNDSPQEASESSIQEVNEHTPNELNSSKQTIATFFGVEISAPAGMKSPLIKLIALVTANILLLILLRSLLF